MPGEGTLFQFELPFEPVVIAAPSPVDDVDLSGISVLLATNGGPAGDWMADVLTGRGMSVARVSGAPEPETAPDHDVAIVDGRLGAATVCALLPDAKLEENQSNARCVWVGRSTAGEATLVPVTRPVHRDGLLTAVAAVLGRASLDAGTGKEIDPIASKAVEPPSVEQALADGRLILVAEDNETNRLVVRRQLALLGLRGGNG